MMQMQMKQPRRAHQKDASAITQNLESSDQEESASEDESGPSKKKSKYASRRSNRNINKRKLDDLICDENSGSEEEKMRKRKPNPRRAATKVISYNDVESAGSDSDYDPHFGEYECTINADKRPPKSFSKIVAQRRGKIGGGVEAILDEPKFLPVGPSTTVYAVEENGDPNEGCDPNDLENTEIQFLVKWKGYSYLHCTWETYDSLMSLKLDALSIQRIRNFMNKEEDKADLRKRVSPEDLEFLAYEQDLDQTLLQNYYKVDRIIAAEDDDSYYLVKWQSLPYVEATWEDADLVERKCPDHVRLYQERENSKKTPSRNCSALKYRPNFVQLATQPAYLGGTEEVALRDYQLHGLNWLIHTWCKEDSVILADEMGLGKTIQTISFLYYLFHEHQVHGPFLIVVPLSTMTSWEREFALWAPEMNVVSYSGDRKSRKLIRQYEWCFANTHRPKFNVILTSYEIVVMDKAVLNGLNWAVLMVDEAHRLKNNESILYRVLSEFVSNHRLLITGTPLQNDLKELWALLHFIMPSKFDSWEEFEEANAGAADQGFTSLHTQLEPYLLRRVKKDVEKSLPAKVEQILRVEMSLSQKKFYRWLLTRNYAALKKETRGSTQSFLNVIMQLRKCCNHSSLIDHPDYESTHGNTAEDQLQQLIRGSGKLILLDKLLTRLRETGHRVLIFSQMVRMLDILAEYLELKRFPFQRLDGNIRGEVRKLAMDHFNAQNSQDFCFLLSTRAGGLGINLATADTVIIFDSDWNPQNDLQAQARAHRIGQTKKVNVYRLVTKSSVEEQIIERAKKKMILDHLIIQRMDTTGRTALNNGSTGNAAMPFDKEELTAILKFGAADLFKSDGVGEEEPVCDIDEILRRAETREDEPGPTTLGDELLSSFKMANFVVPAEESKPRRENNDCEDNADEDWDEIIPKNYRARLEEERRKQEEADSYLPPKRTRKPVQRIDINPPAKFGTDDELSDDNDDQKDEANVSVASLYTEEASSDDSDGASEGGSVKDTAGISAKLPYENFTDVEIRNFVASFIKFPAPLTRMMAIARDANLRHKTMNELSELATYIHEGCKGAEVEMKALSEAEKNNPIKMAFVGTFTIRGVTVNAKNILAAEKFLEPLTKILPADVKERSSWSLDAGSVQRVYTRDLHPQWNVTDDSRLLRGIYEYGMGSWKAIKSDTSLKLANRILLPEVDERLATKALQKRAKYLLKVLKKQLDNKPKSISDAAPLSSHLAADQNGLNQPHEKGDAEESTQDSAWDEDGR